MAELAFLSALAAQLSAASLAPSPATIGVSEPDVAAALPALVLSLESTERTSRSVGERASLMRGALPWAAHIDLANPVLPAAPSVGLLDGTRTKLILPHGGLVQRAGTSGPLSASDLVVRVLAVSRPVVAAGPTGNEVSADADSGTLTFGSPLPLTGFLDAEYFVGSWERRVTYLRGVARLDVCAASASAVVDLGEAALGALGILDAGSAQPLGVLALGLVSLSSVGANEPIAGGLRRRSARIAFQYEHVVDRPDSSGGIIQRVTIDTRLSNGASEIAVS